MDEKQAAAVTRVIKEAQDAHLEEPATKADLRAELAEAKGEIIKWVAVMLAAQAGLIATPSSSCSESSGTCERRNTIRHSPTHTLIC